MANIRNINTQPLPTPFVDKITLNSNYINNRVANTTVDMLMSLKATKSINTGIFDGINIDQTLKLNIIQVLDPDIYAFLCLSSELVYYVLYPHKIRDIPIEILQIAYNRGLINTRPRRETARTFGFRRISYLDIARDELRRLFSNREVIQKREITDFISTKITEKVETLDSGEEILNVYFREKFTVELDTEHLSYFLFCDYDETKFPGLQVNSTESIKVNCEVVFNRSNIVSQTYSYSLDDGTLWTGYVHRTSTGQWKTGKLSDPPQQKRDLIRNIYYNTKIQDFRVFNILEKTNTRSLNISQDLLLKLLKIQFKPKNISPFSFNSTLTKGISVSLNVEKLLKKHSPLYPFISQLEIDNYGSWIKDIRFYRKRVKKQQEIIKDFTKNEKEISIPTKDIVASSDQTGILQLRVNDSTLSGVTAGMYCYGIKVIFVDNILEKLQLELDKLKDNEFLSFLARYYRESLIPENISGGGSYIVELDKFTDSFIRRYSDNSTISNSVNVFIEAFNKISSVPISDADPVKQNLLMQISPETANPDSILSFINLYNSLISTYEKYINLSSSTFLEESMFFSSEGQQVEIAQTEIIKFDGKLSPVENYLKLNLSKIAEQLGVSFEKIQESTGDSIPLQNTIQNISQENNQEEILSISNFVSTATNIAATTEPTATVFKTDLTFALNNTKREVSRELVEVSLPKEIVTVPTPAKEVFFRETPKISQINNEVQTVNLENIKRGLPKVPTTYTTTGIVSSDNLGNLVNKMFNRRRKVVLRRR